MDRQDRIELFLGAFGDGKYGGAKSRLAAAAGLPHATLYRGMEPWQVEQVVAAGASRLGLDRAQVLAWLQGEPDSTMEAALQHLADLRYCSAGQHWCESKEMIRRLSRCRPCACKVSLQRRLADKPHLAAHYKALWDALPQARERDPELAELVEQQLQEGGAVTKLEIGRRLGLTRHKINSRWTNALLPVLVAASLITGQPSRAETRRTNVLVRLVRGRTNSRRRRQTSPRVVRTVAASAALRGDYQIGVLDWSALRAGGAGGDA